MSRVLFGLCTLLTLVVMHSAAAQQRVDAATFARTVSASDGFEIQSSQLALQRSTNPKVRAFAQQMVNDHSRSSAALSQSAPMLTAFSGPSGLLDARHATMLSQLTAQSGPAFDRLYA